MKVQFDQVTVALGGRDVVHAASLEIPSGEVLGVLGPNGSGKSSLLRTLYRAVKPRQGTVRVDGQDVQKLSGKQAARSIAVMLQDPPTDFDLSVAETVLLGRAPHQNSFGKDSAEDLEIVREAMERTEITELSGRMVATLSGGQRQRVMLARALAQRTPVLVLDEPSNHLDISHQHDLMSTVRGLGRTVIAALHDLNLAAQYCDRVLILDAGRIIACGPPHRIITEQLISSVYGVQARILGEPQDPVFAFRRRASPAPDSISTTSAPRAESNLAS
ncbi:ABC transporter ATP-binding protein [Glutamicibacter sp. AOP38-B1-38]|uniref:ABC transporter ATP-binding protein n=1 Tax=Glutamicibacter sp. AOP38-B1-38 TaxID=3457680 RepID=UPI004034BDC8